MSDKLSVERALKKLEYIKRPENSNFGQVPSVNPHLYSQMNKFAQKRDKVYQAVSKSMMTGTTALARLMDKLAPVDMNDATPEQLENLALLVRSFLVGENEPTEA